MFRSALIVVILSMLMPTAWAGHLLSASSKLMLARNRAARGINSPELTRDYYPAFICVRDSSAIEKMRQAGVIVNTVFDGFVSAQVPVKAMKKLPSIDGVSHISLGHLMNLCNDSARILSHVDEVHMGTDMITGFKGRGVVVGLVDTGIDFNHVNLCDENGRSRVRAVYLPCGSSGRAPVIDGNLLPGSCYESPEAIASLKTDCTADSHGSHTAGTAAGSYLPNKMHGVAPEADIVVCGMPESELNDVNIANGVKYIFDYADRHHQPCVVNLSIGSNEGPNDGTSPLCQAFASLTGPGRICVLSAGNDGNAPICFHQSIAGTGDTVTTFLRNEWGGLKREGYVSMWSDKDQIHNTRVVIINRSTGALEYASPFIGCLPEDSVYSISSENDVDFARYYNGEMMFASAFEPSYDGNNGLKLERYHSYWVFDVESLVTGHLLGLQYVADAAVKLSGWSTKKAYFYTFGFDYATGGSTAGSISDLATCDSVISVGAYCSRNGYIDHNGQYQSLNSGTIGEIADFSSFGPDERGISRPDLCAPGQALISSANRYDEKSDRSIWPADVIADDHSYPYYVNQGTSMSAPVVTGAIALMLQINPSLTPSAVRNILKQTTIKDQQVLNGDSERWGSGKLDVKAAVDKVIETALLRGDVNNDHEVTVADVSALLDMLLGEMSVIDPVALMRADVNDDNEIQISDINQLIGLILK